MRPLRLLTVVLAVAALTTATTADAHAAGWVAGPPLSPSDRLADTVRLAVTPNGDRVVAWLQRTADFRTQDGVVVRIAPRGGDFGAPQVLPASTGDIRLAAGPDGTVALAWVDFRDHAAHVARRLPGGGGFVEAPKFVPAGDEQPQGVTVAVHDGAIDAAVATDRQPTNLGRSASVYALRLDAGAATLRQVPGTSAFNGAIVHAADAAGAEQTRFSAPAIAVDRGVVQLAWTAATTEKDGFNEKTAVVQHTVLGAGGTFAAPDTLDQVNGSFSSRTTPVLAAGGGHVYAAWARLLDGRVVARDLAPGATPVTIASSDPGGLRAVADAAGRLTLAWETNPPSTGDEVVAALTIAPGVAPGAPQLLSPRGAVRHLDDLVAGPDGSALALIGRSGFGPVVQVQAALQPLGGAFGTPEEVSGVTDGSQQSFAKEASGAIGADGRVLVAWVGQSAATGASQRAFVSERDAAPPAFGDVVVPPQATAGAPVAFAAGATDALSPATIGWDFGDGSQGDGASPTHVYAAPGTYTVSVTATDAAGNAATVTRTISVAPAATTGQGTGGGGSVKDTVAPVVSGFGLTRTRFRVGPRATATLAAARRPKLRPARTGTAFRASISEPGAVVIAITRKGSRAQPLTLVRARRAAGAFTVAFSGRAGKSRVRAGSYTATLTAIDGAGNRSAPVRASFRVLAG